MNGAVAAAGGDMAKAALDAGPGRQDRRPPRVRSAAGRSSAARTRSEPGGYQAASSLASYVADKVDRARRRARSASSPIAGMIVDGKAGPGTAGGDTIAKRNRRRHRNKGIKALVVRVDSPGGSVLASERIRQALLDAKAKKIPDRRVDGQRRRVGRLLGLDPGRLHLRRALDHHRIDRRVRRPPELPGHAAEARHRRRRGQDDAAVGRAGPAQGPVARSQPADPDRRRIDVRPLPRHRRRSRATRRRSRSTRSRRAACGTAAPRTSSAWSTASAG